jgi:hypothetical protein
MSENIVLQSTGDNIGPTTAIVDEEDFAYLVSLGEWRMSKSGRPILARPSLPYRRIGRPFMTEAIMGSRRVINVNGNLCDCRKDNLLVAS